MTMLTPSISLLYRIDRLRGAVLAWLRHSAHAILFGAIVIVLGVGSALYVADNGTRLTTWRAGPWTMWHQAARQDIDPYTRAHNARQGGLPLSASIAATWHARYDGDGQRLHSSCEYVIEAEPIDATWFSIAVYDDTGRLIPNPADRYAFSSKTLATNPDGSFFISMARDARPGNWLPVGGAGRLSLVLTMVEPKPKVEDSAQQLPSIRRVSCR